MRNRQPDRLLQALAAGTDPNHADAHGRTPLMEAVIDGQGDAVGHLLAAGADPGAQDRDGWTALHFAAQAYDVLAADLLLAHGAPIDARDVHGNTPLARAVHASAGRGAMITLLLQHGADKNAPNTYGVSAASLAASIANFDVARFLR